MMTTSTSVQIPAGPLRPALQACTLFDRWEATAGSNTNLLNRAVADAHSPRVPFARQLKTRLKADLGGLRSEIRQASYTHSRMKTVSYEQAIRPSAPRLSPTTAMCDGTTMDYTVLVQAPAIQRSPTRSERRHPAIDTHH